MNSPMKQALKNKRHALALHISVSPDGVGNMNDQDARDMNLEQTKSDLAPGVHDAAPIQDEASEHDALKVAHDKEMMESPQEEAMEQKQNPKGEAEELQMLQDMIGHEKDGEDLRKKGLGGMARAGIAERLKKAKEKKY